MQQIDMEISGKYNLDVKKIVPFKDAFLINTSRGGKVLRKSMLSAERVMFVHGAKEHLYNNGFKHLDRYLCTKEGAPYAIVDGNVFTITDFIEGSDCNFDSSTDICCAARLLASLHKTSKGYIPPEGSFPSDDLGKLPRFLGKRLEEIKKLEKLAKRRKSKFDNLFLQYVDYFYNLGKDAFDMIPLSKYYEIAESTRQVRLFCHHDYTHHNIISNRDGLWVKNFDFCCFELKVYDIANFLRRKMRKCTWDIREAERIIDEYTSIEPISSDEFFIMKIIMQFPQKFWRVANKYYNSRRSWSENSFAVKLQEVIDEKESHRCFIEKFKSLV